MTARAAFALLFAASSLALATPTDPPTPDAKAAAAAVERGKKYFDSVTSRMR